MQFVPVPAIPKLHTTPMAEVHVERSRVYVKVDDAQERRFRLTFSPLQAVRVTTDDCFLVPEGVVFVHQRVVEVEDSPWVEELRAALKRRDSKATFMDKAHHFLIPAQDNFIEVVSWRVEWESPAGAGTYP